MRKGCPGKRRCKSAGAARLAVLAQLDAISRDHGAQTRTDLGRFCQCRQLQQPSALLAAAVRECQSGRHGTQLLPPATSLPPDLMPTGTGVVLPQLAGIEPELQWVSDNRSLVMLAKSLVESGVADPDVWSRCDKNPSKYVLETARRWIEKHGARQIRRRFDLHLTIADTILAYRERKADEHRLFLIVDPASAGYVILKPSIELLEALDKRLPASLFHSLLGGTNAWVRSYDYRDAEEHTEILREWASSDGDPDGCELPDVEGCTPKSPQERPLSAQRIRKALTAANDPVARRMLKAMLRLNVLSRRYKRPKMNEEIREQLSDCNPPLPCLVAVFSEHDAVEGCFDEEAQNAYEVDPQPNLIIPIDVTSVPSVKNAFDSLKGFCRTMAAAAALLDLMPGNENFVFGDAANECLPEDRNQPDISAEARDPAV